MARLDCGPMDVRLGADLHVSEPPVPRQQIVAEIKQFAAGGKACVINTLNGDTNVPFFKEYAAAGLTAETCPVVSFSISEDEFRGLPAKQLVGQLGCWTYF